MSNYYIVLKLMKKKQSTLRNKKPKCGKNVHFKSRWWVVVFIKPFFTCSLHSKTHEVSSTWTATLCGSAQQFSAAGDRPLTSWLGPRGTGCCYLGARKRPSFKLQTHSPSTRCPHHRTPSVSGKPPDLPPAPTLWGKDSWRAQQTRWWSHRHDLGYVSLFFMGWWWGWCKGLAH